jgi:hypothetical protein
VVVKRVLVPIAVVVVAIGAAASAGLLVRRHVSGRGGLPSLVLNGGSTTCYMSELRVSYFGTEASAGSAITGFRVTDRSMLPCTLSGSPLLGLYGGPLPAGKPLHARLEGFASGPFAAARTAATVLIEPKSDRYAAAFVIATLDSSATGSANCSRLAAIEVGLYPHGKRAMVPLSPPEKACGSPPRISVSGFFSSERLDSYIKRGY